MSDVERTFHETWLGLAQPYEGLVLSVPVLVEAECVLRQPLPVHERFLSLLSTDSEPQLTSLDALLTSLLDLGPERFDSAAALPEALSLYVAEGKQTLRPTLALKRAVHDANAELVSDDPAVVAGGAYRMLVWQVPSEVIDLDKPETLTGPWDYPASAKFERLLRACRVPVGLLVNGRELRLCYAPHGESPGWLSFRVKDMASVIGRPLLDAFVMLLHRERWFAVAPERQLPALLEQSRRRQAAVTNALSRQVFEALEILLAGFVAAAERDGDALLREALESEDEALYAGLLTLLLRLVFVLYCEDRGLFPVEHTLYAQHLSVLGLHDELVRDRGAHPDSMARRFGGYGRLVALFRAVFLGARHGDFYMPSRRGQLFDPNTYSFLEGWAVGNSAPIREGEARAAVRVPSLDDGTLCAVLERLLMLDGQRLSYRALDVEQIGSVYEALMGFRIERIEHAAVRLRPSSKKGVARVWLEAQRVLDVPKARRAKWLEDTFDFDKGSAKKVAEALNPCSLEVEALAALEGLAGRNAQRSNALSLVVQPGPERRRTSSHYTPRELTEPIVACTLTPLVRAMGDVPRSESLLQLVICDPAMGSGAFLVAACRWLADQVVAAWTREGRLTELAKSHGDLTNYARRLVAQRCLYGVDKNPYAVQLARLSLWLVTMAKDEPFTFVDHALRHGDSLLGLDFDQLRAFHWKPERQLETCAAALQQALEEAILLRQQIQALAFDDSPDAQRDKERLLRDAEDALNRVRLVGDLVIGAFFAEDSDKAREKERTRRLTLVECWLRGEDELELDLRQLQAQLREKQVPFHWMVEFPEVFYGERPDPLEADARNGKAYVEAFVGNPPFAGKNGITEQGGPAYLEWLQTLHKGAHGNADLVAHFFRRAARLLGAHGTIGLIATNTVGQGDTRAVGLQALVHSGFTIYDAIPTLPWPGDAAVTVSVVHLAHGSARGEGFRFDGRVVSAINSRLRPKPERADPSVLAANGELAFVGTYVLGMGFTLTPAEREALVAKDARNAERIFPYLGGEEVNTNPDQGFDRYVISFGQMTLEEAERWPDLIEIVREKVKPERDELKDNADGKRRKEHWWQFGRWTPALYQAIGPLQQCLVTARVSKHLIISVQPPSRIFSEQLYAFALDSCGSFAILQSRIHEPWARLLSSSMKTDLRYAASDCFETFPFPQSDPRAALPALEAAGERLYSVRADYMRDRQLGLTKTYNALKDPACTELPILALRTLHEEMDLAVLTAYGWNDLPVPPYCLATDADKRAHEAFEDEVIDRLFLLNAQRAQEEAVLGPGGGKKAKKGKKAGSGSSGQGTLFGG